MKGEEIEKNLFISIDRIEEKEIKKFLYLILEKLIKCQTSLEEIKEKSEEKSLVIKKINEKLLNIKKKFYDIDSSLPKSKEKKKEIKIEKKEIKAKEKKEEIKKKKEGITKKERRKISLIKELEEIRKKLKSLE